MPGEAEVKYLDGDFRVVRPGAFVRCAVTNVPIPLEELKYWSVELQEAYATPEAVLQRHASGASQAGVSFAQAPSIRPANRIRFVDLHRRPAGRGALRRASRPPRRPSGARGPSRSSADRACLARPRANERARLGGAVAMMIGEAAPDRGIDPGRARGSRRISPDRRCRRMRGPSCRAAMRPPRHRARACRETPAGRARARLTRAPVHRRRRSGVRRRASSCGSSGARSGPAGITRPLPMPRAVDHQNCERSLASDGFWKPSSITMTLAPLRPGEPRARDAILRHDGRRDAREQQRLVADLRRRCASARPITGPASLPP